MARIRSIHPSLFTDEAWVACSPLSRVLYIGLLTDADDQGLFEWKPLQIKMRLLPGDNADVVALLDELVSVDLITPLESGGKRLGAIRKFRRFQRPKKPNSIFVLPPEFRTYVGLSEDGSELDDDEEDAVRKSPPPKTKPVPKKSELGERMEDGGGRRDREKDSVPVGTGAPAPPTDDDRFVEIGQLADPGKRGWDGLAFVLTVRGSQTAAKAKTLIGKWKRDHALTGDEMWAMADGAWKAETRDPEPYLARAAAQIAERRAKAAPAGRTPSDEVPDYVQRVWMEDFRDTPLQWKRHERGPKPGEPGCRVRPEIQREFGVEPATPVPTELFPRSAA